VNNQGALSIGSGATWSQTQGLSSSGTLGVGSGGTFINSSALSNTGKLSNTGMLTNVAGGTLNNQAGGTLNNVAGGTLTNLAGGALSNTGKLSNAGTLTNVAGGTLTNVAGGTLTNLAGGTLTNNATLSNAGVLTNQTGGVLTNNATLTNSGTLSNQTGGMLVNNASFTDSGRFVDSGAVTGGGQFIQTGGLSLITGSLTQSTVSLQGGTLLGSGSITGTVSNSGAIINSGPAVGTAGTLTIDGSFSQTAGSLIELIKGTGTGQYSELLVNGNAALGGNLNIMPTFALAAGEKFTVLTVNGGTLSGMFGHLDYGSQVGSGTSVSIGNHLAIDAVYAANGVQLDVVAVPGVGGAGASGQQALAAAQGGYTASNVSIHTPVTRGASQEFLVGNSAPEIDPTSAAGGLTLLLGGLLVLRGRRATTLDGGAG
jgi:hypothetical protein